MALGHCGAAPTTPPSPAPPPRSLGYTDVYLIQERPRRRGSKVGTLKTP